MILGNNTKNLFIKKIPEIFGDLIRFTSPVLAMAEDYHQLYASKL